MTTHPLDPAKRLAELLETLPAAERQELTAWLLGQGPARGRTSLTLGWMPAAELGRTLTGALPAGEDSQLVTIRLPADRHLQLRTWCTEHGFTMAAVVRGLIERFLEQRERAGGAG
jgi:hypothetical protein